MSQPPREETHENRPHGVREHPRRTLFTVMAHRTRPTDRPNSVVRLGSVALASAGLVLGLAACSSPAAKPRAKAPMDRLSGSTSKSKSKTKVSAPPCQYGWLSVHLDKAGGGATQSSTNPSTNDILLVSTTTECRLRGWVAFRHVPASRKGPVSARPAITEHEYGSEHNVVLTPGASGAAAESLTVTVPSSQLASGNLCAGYVSTLFRLPEQKKSTFLLDLPSAPILCGGTGPVHVLAGPIASLQASTTAGVTHVATRQSRRVVGSSGSVGSSGAAGSSADVDVPYGDVEVQIPGSWWVNYGNGPGCDSPPPPGQVVLGVSPGGCPSAAEVPANTVLLKDISKVPPPYNTKKPTDVNGVPVIIGPTAKHSITYYLPSVLEELVATGPAAVKAARTISWSPRETTLGSGPIMAPGSNWQTVKWRGLTAEVPAGWSISHTPYSNAPLCGTDETSLPAGQVLLDSDQRDVYPPCPYQFPTVQNLFASGGDGLRIDLHPWRAASGRGDISSTCLDVNGLTACPYGQPSMAGLELQVTGGDLAHPRLVWIGLGAGGETARTILYSLASAS